MKSIHFRQASFLLGFLVAAAGWSCGNPVETTDADVDEAKRPLGEDTCRTSAANRTIDISTAPSEVIYNSGTNYGRPGSPCFKSRIVDMLNRPHDTRFNVFVEWTDAQATTQAACESQVLIMDIYYTLGNPLIEDLTPSRSIWRGVWAGAAGCSLTAALFLNGTASSHAGLFEHRRFAISARDGAGTAREFRVRVNVF